MVDCKAHVEKVLQHSLSESIEFYALENKVLALKIVSTRKNVDDIVDVMLWQDSSYDSSSSEDDLDELLLEFMFPQQNDANYPRINLQDIPDVQCQAMFRYKFLRLWSSLEQLSFMLANFISASCIYIYKSSLSISDFQKDIWEDSGKHCNCQPITFALKGLLLLGWRH